MLKPVKHMFEDPSFNFILDYNQFKNFMTSTENPKDIAKDYAANLNDLINVFISTHFPLQDP